MHPTELKLIMTDLKLPPMAESTEDNPQAGQTSYTLNELIRLTSRVEEVTLKKVQGKVDELIARQRMGG